MTWYEGVLLGLLQGATEFLPVSSSGHLVVGQYVLGIDAGGVGLEATLHLATLVSVLVVYRHRIGTLLMGVAGGQRDQRRYAGLLLLASIPASLAGLGLRGFLESLFEVPAVTGAALLVTGCVVWSARRALASRPAGEVELGTALMVGAAQALAIVPGISRSGATVVTALWRGVDPSEAAAFSFLMSVPVIAGAALLQVSEISRGAAMGEEVAGSVLLLSAGVACVAGIAAIRLFRSMLSRESFHRFGPYLWVMGTLFLGWVGLR